MKYIENKTNRVGRRFLLFRLLFRLMARYESNAHSGDCTETAEIPLHFVKCRKTPVPAHLLVQMCCFAGCCVADGVHRGRGLLPQINVGPGLIESHAHTFHFILKEGALDFRLAGVNDEEDEVRGPGSGNDLLAPSLALGRSFNNPWEIQQLDLIRRPSRTSPFVRTFAGFGKKKIGAGALSMRTNLYYYLSQWYFG